MSILLFGVLTLSSCASLPAKEATAFKELATADRDAFQNLADNQQKSRLSDAQSLLRQNLIRVEVAGDCKSNSATDCLVTYTMVDGTAGPAFATPAPNSRALLSAISRYGDNMAQLAEAKDLTTVKAKSQAAAGSVKALATLLGPVAAPIGVIIDAAVFAGNAGLKEKRRRAMLTVAKAAQPKLADAAEDLTEIAKLMSDDIRAGSAAEIRDLRRRIKEDQEQERRLKARYGRNIQVRPNVADRIDRLQDRRSENLSKLVNAAEALNRSRAALKFDKLAEAHALLIQSLEDPDASIEEAMTDINEFLALLESAKSAAAPATNPS